MKTYESEERRIIFATYWNMENISPKGESKIVCSTFNEINPGASTTIQININLSGAI